ncbi:MAG: hypothetical protein AB7E31_11965 [Desulfitobacterium sp.]
MKNGATLKFITLAVFVLVTVSLFVFTIFFVKGSPEEYAKEKYSNNKQYNIILHSTNGLYEGLLGDDQENIYLDLFRDGDYFGGSTMAKNKNDTVQIYQFQQNETLIVVYGYNDALKHTSYILEIGGTKEEPLSITKRIKQDMYILDI